jgi:hypothetical protein
MDLQKVKQYHKQEGILECDAVQICSQAHTNQTTQYQNAWHQIVLNNSVRTSSLMSQTNDVYKPNGVHIKELTAKWNVDEWWVVIVTSSETRQRVTAYGTAEQ